MSGSRQLSAPQPMSGFVFKEDTAMTTTNSAKPLLYLAGGFRSRWQQKVHERLGLKYVILDLSAHGIENRDDYTRWDLNAIRRSDAVLAFMEHSNPGGYSLAL